MKYEEKVHRIFEDRFALRYFPSIWWKYYSKDRVRYCQTDGILIDEERKRILIIEIKYSHTSDAFWQVENVYVPVLRKFFERSNFSIATCEVVKWFDPSVSYPKQPNLRESLEAVKVGEFAVHILNRI